MREKGETVQIDTLRYFVEVAHTGSFYGASKRIYVSQQGLNKAVTSLETELGATLFERGKRGVRLTAAGESLLPHAQRIVEERDSALDDLFELARREGTSEERLAVHTTYYSAQIAAGSIEYVTLLNKTSYIEEPFTKVVEQAAQSDNSDLYFVDLHPNTQDAVLARKDLAFDPVIGTDVGVVWHEGSQLANVGQLHRAYVAKLPLATNTFKEMAQLMEWLFADTPLQNVRLGAASPRMLLEFVQSQPDSVALFDSFGFYLSQLDPDMPTDGLHFTPLATPLSHCECGFLTATSVKPTPGVRHAIRTMKRFLADSYADYLEKHPPSARTRA